MIRLILLLAAIAVVAYGATWLAENPGDVVMRWQGFQVETSVAVLLVLFVLASLVLAFVFEVFRWLRGVPRRIVESRARSRQTRGYRELALGLVAAAAGDPRQARGHHRKAERLLGDNPATLLLSAQAAQLEGREEAAQQKFQQMLESPDTEFLGLRGLLAQAMKAGDLQAALDLARRAYLRRPSTPWVLHTLFDLQTRSANWRDALATVDDMARYKLLEPAAATKRRAILHHMVAQRLREEGDDAEALRFARKAAKLAPDFAPAAVQAAELAKEQGRARLARKLIETGWSAAPHPMLAKAYHDLYGSESHEERRHRFERLYNLRPDDVETHLALAELALEAESHETARAHLERAESARPSARVYRMFAELERAASGDAVAIGSWLSKAMEAEPDPAWVCAVTGVVLPRWSVFGPNGEFGSVQWTTPPSVATLLDDERPRVLLANGGELGEPPAGKSEPVTVIGDGSPPPRLHEAAR